MQCVCLTSKHVKYHLQHCNASYLETCLWVFGILLVVRLLWQNSWVTLSHDTSQTSLMYFYFFLFLCCRENEDCLVKCQSWRKLAVTGRQDDLQAGSCAVHPSKHGCEMCVHSFVCFFFLNIWIETHCEISYLQHLSLITHYCFSGGGAVPELIQQRAVCSPEERGAVFS